MLDEAYRAAKMVFPETDFKDGHEVSFSVLRNSATSFVAKLVRVGSWPDLRHEVVSEKTVEYQEVSGCKKFKLLLKRVSHFSLSDRGLFVSFTENCDPQFTPKGLDGGFERNLTNFRRMWLSQALSEVLQTDPQIVGELHRERLVGTDAPFVMENNAIRYHLVVPK